MLVRTSQSVVQRCRRRLVLQFRRAAAVATQRWTGIPAVPLESTVPRTTEQLVVHPTEAGRRHSGRHRGSVVGVVGGVSQVVVHDVTGGLGVWRHRGCGGCEWWCKVLVTCDIGRRLSHAGVYQIWTHCEQSVNKRERHELVNQPACGGAVGGQTAVTQWWWWCNNRLHERALRQTDVRSSVYGAHKLARPAPTTTIVKLTGGQAALSADWRSAGRLAGRAATPSGGRGNYGHLRRLVGGEDEEEEGYSRSQWRRFALEIAARRRLLLLLTIYRPPHQSFPGVENSATVT